MKHRLSKDSILQACIQKQRDLIDGFKERIGSRKEDTFNAGESASQTENRNAGKVDILNALEAELAFAQQELAYLDLLEGGTENTDVAPGAVVVTDQMAFFISVSGERINVDGETIFAISTRAPLYGAMMGLQKGATFAFNGKSYHIEDVY